MKRCKYCGNKTDDILEFCCESCEKHYKKAVEKDSRYVKYFVSGILIGFVTMFCGILAQKEKIIGAGILIMGVDAVLFPFVTPETAALLGYQKSKILGEIMGVLMVLAGIWVGFM